MAISLQRRLFHLLLSMSRRRRSICFLCVFVCLILCVLESNDVDFCLSSIEHLSVTRLTCVTEDQSVEQTWVSWNVCCWLLMVLTTRMLTRTITHAARSFSVSGPRVSNYLTPALRASYTTLLQFESRLKTTLFRLAYETWLGAFLTV